MRTILLRMAKDGTRVSHEVGVVATMVAVEDVVEEAAMANLEDHRATASKASRIGRMADLHEVAMVVLHHSDLL